MPNYGKHSKTHSTIGILLLLGITILALAVTLSPNNATGQEQTLHDMTVYEPRSQPVGSGETLHDMTVYEARSQPVGSGETPRSP